MRTGFSPLRLLTVLWCAAVLLSPHGAQASASATFYVPINRAELITTNTDMSEVIVTDPDVADVFAHGKRKVSVIGKQIGQTTLRIFDAKHNLLRSMDVYVTYDLPAVRRALREFLPNERIGVSMVNTRMALTGNVSSAESASSAMEIAEEFISGKLSNGDAKSRPARTEDGERSPVINMMKLVSGQQVMLRIRVGEVQRSSMKNLGVNLTAVDTGELGFTIGTGSGQFGDGGDSFGFNNFFGTTGGASFGTVAGSIQRGSYGLAGAIDALEREGMLKVLAEPNLVALSGEEAQFLAGGEFPIAVPQEGGVTTIEYKPFGVALKFTPFVLSENRLRIKVQPEVSELSSENSIRVGSTSVPSLVTRRASTTVELAPGESFMIAGLIRDSMVSQINELPGAADIPVLSALFRSTAYQRNESELVIAVTPYLVDPMKDADVKMPTDDFRPASFMESIFFGAIGSNRGIKDPSLEGPSGFMMD